MNPFTDAEALVFALRKAGKWDGESERGYALRINSERAYAADMIEALETRAEAAEKERDELRKRLDRIDAQVAPNLGQQP